MASICAAMPQAIVQKGIFPNKDLKVPEQVAFAHLDVDQERCYRESLDFLMPRMMKGGMMLCDDYCLVGAARAIDAVNDDLCVKAELADGRMLLLF